MSKARLTLGDNSSWLEGASLVVDLRGKRPLSNAEILQNMPHPSTFLQ